MLILAGSLLDFDTGFEGFVNLSSGAAGLRRRFVARQGLIALTEAVVPSRCYPGFLRGVSPSFASKQRKHHLNKSFHPENPIPLN